MRKTRKCAALSRGKSGKVFGSGMLIRTSSTSTQEQPTQTGQEDFIHQIMHITADTNAFSFVEILKSCTKSMSLEHGNLTYFAIVEKSLETNLFIGNTLISLYDKCHCLEDAESVFTRMPQTNVVTWNAFLSCHVKHGHDLIVFYLFRRMQLEGWQPDKFTYVSILKACWNLDSLCEGRMIHTLILAAGFQQDVYVASAIVHMYSSCCSLGIAHAEFEKIENQNVVTWNALMAGYIKDGRSQMVLMIFHQMQHENVQPNDATLISVLKAITNIQSLWYGMLVHALILEFNLDLSVIIGTALIGMYSACKSLKEAEEVFERLSKACPITWTALLTCYIEHGSNAEAFRLFKRMLTYGLALNSVIYLSLLKACTEIAGASIGMLIHALIIESCCEREEFLKNALIAMHFSLGNVADACLIFNLLSTQSVVTWSTVIDGYADLGYAEEALALFQQMLQHGARPNYITYLSVLKACSSLQALGKGGFVHVQVRASDLSTDLVVGNMLIDMYAKCGSIARALQVFRELPKQSLLTWNAIISGYLNCGDGWEALCLFQNMQKEGVVYNNVTVINLLKTCCCLAALQEGRLVHINAMYRNMETDAILQSGLIDFYIKHGSLQDAEKQFDYSLKQDRAPCNAMITGYAHHGCCQRAFGLFLDMLKEGIKPDVVTFLALVRACSEALALFHGKLTHQYVIQTVHSTSLIVENALIDMYAKCGSMVDAQKLFDGLANRDVISWTALIAGHAIDGEIGIALQCFVKMLEDGFKPNEATFVSILSGCGHAGLVYEAVLCMDDMTGQHTVVPTDDHHNSMVDALARYGHLMEAEDYMKTTPSVQNAVGWASLLSHCNTHVSIDVGLGAFEQFMRFDDKHASAYLQMAVLLNHARDWCSIHNLDSCRVGPAA